MDAKDVVIHHSIGDWAAVYVDGKLERIGDTADMLEHALEELGVRMVWDSQFMLGQTKRDGAAKTLEEIEAYEIRRSQSHARLNELQDEINKIRKEFP